MLGCRKGFGRDRSKEFNQLSWLQMMLLEKRARNLARLVGCRLMFKKGWSEEVGR